MNYSYWFEQKWSIKGHIYVFKGALLGPSSNYEDDCSTTDTYETCSDNCQTDCGYLDNWYSSGVAYVFFDVIATLIVVLISIILALDLLKFPYLKRVINVYTTGILMIVVALIHLLTFIIWAGAVHLQFDNCTHHFPYSGVKTICGKGGAAFALWNVFYLIIVSVGYFFIARKIKIEEEKENEQQRSQEPLVLAN